MNCWEAPIQLRRKGHVCCCQSRAGCRFQPVPGLQLLWPGEGQNHFELLMPGAHLGILIQFVDSKEENTYQHRLLVAAWTQTYFILFWLNFKSRA